MRLDTSKVRVGPPMGDWYFPKVEYTTKQGKKLQSETTDAQYGKDLKAGQTFTVVYDSRHPEHVASGTRFTWMKTSLFTLLLGILFLFIA